MNLACKIINSNINICKTKPFKRKFFTAIQMCNKTDSEETKNESPLKRMLNEASTFEDIQTTNPEQQWATLPYPAGTPIRKQGEYFKTQPKNDPRDSSIILFPGQGSQYVGMAKGLLKFPMAKDLFELASYILKYDLLKICLEGPQEKLNETRYCQPATMVCSLAAIEKLKEERPNAIEQCAGTAGFSLGEITALVFAGAIGFERALRLVQIRAEAMQLASDTYKGAMVTVFYGPDAKLTAACKEAKQWALDKGDPMPECVIANYLYPDCKVLSGSESAIDFIEKNYKSFNFKRVKRLPVNGAFHSSLMELAVEPFRKALLKSEVQDPIISVYSNVDGRRYRNAQHIKSQLPKQIVRPVKWEQLLHVIYERDREQYFPRTFECGPGHSLKTILKLVNAKAWNECYTIET